MTLSDAGRIIRIAEGSDLPRVNMSTIRLYHFLPAEHALDNIRKRRIKIAEIDQLNDPFELWCVAQDNKELRARLRDYKRTMDERFGLLCFCRGWSNPLLWSHYANKHRGMCLGFDLEENTVRPVTYVAERVPIQYPFIENIETISDQLLWTKYIGWQYEEELRSWIKFIDRDPETKLYFCDFDEKIRLKEVIAGTLCDVTEREIREALGDMRDVAAIKARLAFKTFRVVRMGWGFDTSSG